MTDATGIQIQKGVGSSPYAKLATAGKLESQNPIMRDADRNRGSGTFLHECVRVKHSKPYAYSMHRNGCGEFDCGCQMQQRVACSMSRASGSRDGPSTARGMIHM